MWESGRPRPSLIPSSSLVTVTEPSTKQSNNFHCIQPITTRPVPARPRYHSDSPRLNQLALLLLLSFLLSIFHHQEGRYTIVDQPEKVWSVVITANKSTRLPSRLQAFLNTCDSFAFIVIRRYRIYQCSGMHNSESHQK